MLGFGSRDSKNRGKGRDRRSGRRGPGVRCRRAHVPRLEGLEVRRTPATGAGLTVAPSLADVAGARAGDPTTTTSLFAIPNPAAAGQTVTLTAEVIPASFIPLPPTGMVAFLVDGNLLGEVPLNSSTLQATLSTNSIPAGQHVITAFYFGDTNYSSSTGGLSLLVQVGIPGTQTTLTAHAARNRHGQFAVDLVAQVAVTPPSTGTPTGTVTFYRDGLPMRTVALGRNGTAILQTAPIRVRYHYIYAAYNGSASLQPSVSRARTVFVKNLKKTAQLDVARVTVGQGGAAPARGPAVSGLSRWDERHPTGPRRSS